MQNRIYVIPFRTIEKPSFWRGVLSTFNLFPVIERHSTGHGQTDDALLMAGDWIAIGNDLENALGTARTLYGHSVEARGVNATITSESDN